MNVEEKLQALGWKLPAPIQLPPGVALPFTWVRRFEQRVFVSGHGPLSVDGSMPELLGKVGGSMSLEQAQAAAGSATLSMLASLRHEIGSLEGIAAWLTVNGLVNVAPGFIRTTDVINPASEMLLELFGPEVGRHARTAIGVAQLPMDLPVILSAEIALKPGY